MFSLWCASLPTLDFAFFILEWTIIVKRIRYYIKQKTFQTTREAINTKVTKEGS